MSIVVRPLVLLATVSTLLGVGLTAQSAHAGACSAAHKIALAADASQNNAYVFPLQLQASHIDQCWKSGGVSSFRALGQAFIECDYACVVAISVDGDDVEVFRETNAGWVSQNQLSGVPSDINVELSAYNDSFTLMGETAPSDCKDINLSAGGGSDVIRSDCGDDRLFTGGGNDVIFAGPGHDLVLAGSADDVIHGESGDDVIFGGGGDDTINGGLDHDSIHGDNGKDILSGAAGDDVVHGGGGGDAIVGGPGDDELSGGSGNDDVWEVNLDLVAAMDTQLGSLRTNIDEDGLVTSLELGYLVYVVRAYLEDVAGW